MQPVKHITSAKNPEIKRLVDLRERKARDKTGLIIVEGTRELSCAKKAGVSFKEIYTCAEFFRGEEARKLAIAIEREGAKAFETSQDVFSKISFGERLEGLIAVCEKPKRKLEGLMLSSAPFLVVVEGVEKPGNLGAVLRTADAAGVDGVIVTDGSTDISNPNVVRSSLGTVFSVSAAEASNEATLNFLKNNNVKIAAADPTAEKIYTDFSLNVPLAIVLGSEQKGLSSFWQKNCDFKMKIPMRGAADSLNVSTTAAILIYETLRQRSLKK